MRRVRLVWLLFKFGREIKKLMALKDDFTAAVSNLSTTSQQVIDAFAALKQNAGTVDDATVQAGVDAIKAATTNLNALVTPPTTGV